MMSGPDEFAPALGGYDPLAPGLKRRRDRVARWSPAPNEVAHRPAERRVPLEPWQAAVLRDQIRLTEAMFSRPNPFAPTGDATTGQAIRVMDELPPWVTDSPGRDRRNRYRTVMRSDGETVRVSEVIEREETPEERRARAMRALMGGLQWTPEEMDRLLAQERPESPILGVVTSLGGDEVEAKVDEATAFAAQGDDEGLEFCGDRDCERCSPGPEDEDDGER